MAELLITGGAGFIGSHTCLVLLEAGHDLVVLDDFSNSSPESLKRVRQLANLESNSPLYSERMESRTYPLPRNCRDRRMSKA